MAPQKGVRSRGKRTAERRGAVRGGEVQCGAVRSVAEKCAVPPTRWRMRRVETHSADHRRRLGPGKSCAESRMRVIPIDAIEFQRIRASWTQIRPRGAGTLASPGRGEMGAASPLGRLRTPAPAASMRYTWCTLARPETRDPRPEARDPRSANRDPRSGQEKAPEVRVTSAIPEGSPQVEMAGIEPASVGILPGLLRAQFVKQLLRSWSSHEHVDQRTELSKSPIDTPNMCRQQWLPS